MVEDGLKCEEKKKTVWVLILLPTTHKKNLIDQVPLVSRMIGTFPRKKNCCSFGFCPNYTPHPYLDKLYHLF